MFGSLEGYWSQNLNLKIKFRIELGEAGRRCPHGQWLSWCEATFGQWKKQESPVQEAWVWTSGKWPGLIAEVEGQHPGYVFVWDPSSVKGAVFEQPYSETFSQFIAVSVLGLSRASACPRSTLLAEMASVGRVVVLYPLGSMFQVVRVKLR